MTKRQKIEKLKNIVFELFPQDMTDLWHVNDFQLLIATILSAQTTDRQVNRVTQDLFPLLNEPKDWLKLWVEKIEKLINKVWLYRNKAKNIFKTCEILSEKNLENFHTLEDLKSLPWVWVKTAKIFLSVARKQEFLAVDTHVHRVLNRLWIVDTKTPEQTDKEAERIFTKDDLLKLHFWLILFWRYYCVARNPNCEICPIQDSCKFFKKKK